MSAAWDFLPTGASPVARAAGTRTGTQSSNLRDRHDLIIRANTHEPFAFSEDGRLLAIWREAEKRVDIVDLTSGDVVATLRLTGTSNVSVVSLIRNGAALALGSRDRSVRIWNLRPTTGPVVNRAHAPEEAWALAFSPDGRTLASGGDDHQIRIWATATGREQATLSRHVSLVTSLAFSNNGSTLDSGSFDKARPVILWDVASGLPRFELNGHASRVRALALSPDDRVLASVGEDETLKLWSINEGRLLHTFSKRVGRLNCVAFSPDGRTLASTGVRMLILTNTLTGSSRTIDVDNEPGALAFSTDGSRMYCAHQVGAITIWDVAKGKQAGALPGHDSVIESLAVSPDGTTLASAGDDRTVRLWDTVSGQELLCLTDCKNASTPWRSARTATLLPPPITPAPSPSGGRGLRIEPHFPSVSGPASRSTGSRRKRSIRRP
jgi:eukaryotic-like serine/threonine-protein kinase